MLHFDEDDSPTDRIEFLSLTPSEARTLADILLAASQRMEDQLPHYNN